MRALASIPELTEDLIQEVESKMLNMEQADCPVENIFGPGIYIRQQSFPAGALVIGHSHKHEHTAIMLQGRATFLLQDGSTKTISAPWTSRCPAGRKIAYVHEDMVFQNVFATDETDLDKLEDQLITKSETFLNHLKLHPTKEPLCLSQ
jgi:hypothetical protein